MGSKNKIMFRTMLVTLGVIALCFIAFYFIGIAFKNTEKIAYNRNSELFEIVDKDKFSLFGKEFSLPIISVAEKLKEIFLKYSSGLLRVFSYVINGIKEGINLLIK